MSNSKNVFQSIFPALSVRDDSRPSVEIVSAIKNLGIHVAGYAEDIVFAAATDEEIPEEGTSYRLAIVELSEFPEGAIITEREVFLRAAEYHYRKLPLRVALLLRENIGYGQFSNVMIFVMSEPVVCSDADARVLAIDNDGDGEYLSALNIRFDTRLHAGVLFVFLAPE